MARRIFVTGATGLVGGRLCEELAASGDTVLALTRGRAASNQEGVEWIEGDLMRPGAWGDAVASADAVVHLAGESVAATRWTPARKGALVASRVEGTRHLVDAMAAENGPRALISASAAGFYGRRGEEQLVEGSEPGDDFLARLCVSWESAARRAEQLGARVVMLRFGVVLAARGGALPRMLTPFRLGLGGPLGPADRFTPWIHLDDAVGLARFGLETTELSGPVNAVAPHAIRMGEFARTLGRALGRPAIFPVPEFVLRAILGEATDAVVPGQYVVPEVAHAAGYRFAHPELPDALADLLGD